MFNYFNVSYSNSTALGTWCASCHDRHLAARGNSGSVDSDDATFRFRRNTDGTNASCMDCHVAHGTSARIGANSAGVPWPDGTMPTAQSRSSNLRLDNRGVCQSCHNK